MKAKIKVIGLLVICLVAACNLFAQGSLEITVKNIKETKGSIRVGLFTNEKDFLKKVAEGKIVKANANEITVIFENLKTGDYGISVMHDENENGKLDSNFVGIPKEGFGFGNNAMGTFGPPSFDKAKVTLEKTDIKQVISLKHF